MPFFNGYCLIKGCNNEALTGSPYCLDHQPRYAQEPTLASFLGTLDRYQQEMNKLIDKTKQAKERKQP